MCELISSVCIFLSLLVAIGRWEAILAIPTLEIHDAF